MTKQIDVIDKSIVPFNPDQAERFVKLLNSEPRAEDVKEFQQRKYLPISFIEMKLDELFFGLWQTKWVSQQVVANEIVGVIELGVYHPVMQQWIWKTGLGAVMIQQAKGSDITDISAKGKNTLVKDFPHLKAECIKNAAKSLGKVFGRDLNRANYDDYNPLMEQSEQVKGDNVVEQINNVSSLKELGELWKANPDWSKNDLIFNKFLAHKKELQKRA